MSNQTATPSPVNDTPTRPVSLVTIVFLFVLFAAFFFVARWLYRPATAAPNHTAIEGMGKDFEWRATRDARKATLQTLRETQTKQISSYGWVDQKAGVVHLPIERAMELTVQQYGAKK